MGAPQFISTDSQLIMSELIDLYQSITGTTILPSQPEYQLIMALAARELSLRYQIQAVGQANLVNYATAPALDELGVLVGVTRVSSQPASATVQFTLPSSHGGVIIPVGTRVGPADGLAKFETIQALTVAAGVTTATVDVICQTLGTVGNGYTSGQISIILDPQPYLNAVTNTTTTAGGSDAETDEQLRARIKLAPSSFSTAGSVQAYRYHAFTASPTIVDVYVPEIPDTPGTVEIFVLVEGGGSTPSGILTDVANACNSERVRPLTDTLDVKSAVAVDYDIEAVVTLVNDADPASNLAAIQNAIETFTASRLRTMGANVMRAQLIGEIYRAAPGAVFDVTLTEPALDLVINAGEFANIGDIEITLGSPSAP